MVFYECMMTAKNTARECMESDRLMSLSRFFVVMFDVLLDFERRLVIHAMAASQCNLPFDSIGV